MLLSPPRDIPEAALPAGSHMKIGTRDADPPVVMMRCMTPANRLLQHLEAGHLGASTPQHVMSRPAVHDLCITSTNLLSLIDPLPMDRLSRHTVAAVCSWPAVDHHHILAVTTGSNFYRFLSYYCMCHISGFICSGSICSDKTSGLVYLESNHFVIHFSSALHFRTYASFIESGYSYYVNML